MSVSQMNQCAGYSTAPLWRRIAIALAAAVAPISGAPYGAAAAEPDSKRGGTLEFAVLVEPGNYDCHGNISFAFLHPIAPHYSTLLKFDAPNYPQIVGDLAESWNVSPDRLTYTFKLRPNILFHDGSKLTSADVKASYERVVHPPAGVVSARKVDYAAVASIDTPDPRTVVFHLQWPEAAMLANFASPWNCIYSAAKLAEDPQFPKTHILGTGPFVFAEHVKGQFWRGVRWDKYFQPGKPYLDGYRANFMTGAAVMSGYKSGHIAAEFRGVTPVQRDQLAEALGGQIEVSESPWLSNLLVSFNSKRPRSTMYGCVARCRSPSTGGARRQNCKTRPSSNMSAGSCAPAPAWQRRKRSWSQSPVSRETSPPRAKKRSGFSRKPGFTTSN
jgi:peptide/nickel transport system substrate-binding protein